MSKPYVTLTCRRRAKSSHLRRTITFGNVEDLKIESTEAVSAAAPSDRRAVFNVRGLQSMLWNHRPGYPNLLRMLLVPYPNRNGFQNAGADVQTG